MAMKAQRIDTWAAGMQDKPGALAEKLDALAAAGANLEFVIARRTPDKPGSGVVFVTPIKGAKQTAAAKKAGFMKSTGLHAVRIDGTDKKGQGAAITRVLADNGINLRGLSAAAIGNRFVAHIALDQTADASKAIRLLKKL